MKSVVEARHDSAYLEAVAADVMMHIVADGGNLQLKCGCKCKLPYAGCLMIGPRTPVTGYT